MFRGVTHTANVILTLPKQQSPPTTAGSQGPESGWAMWSKETLDQSSLANSCQTCLHRFFQLGQSLSWSTCRKSQSPSDSKPTGVQGPKSAQKQRYKVPVQGFSLQLFRYVHLYSDKPECALKGTSSGRFDCKHGKWPEAETLVPKIKT